MENVGSVRRAVAVEVESPPPELYAVEEAAVYVSERGTLERGRREELYRRFRELYPHLPAQLVQQAMRQGSRWGNPFWRRGGTAGSTSPAPR